MSIEDIAVIGAGSYGTCLAMLFGNAGHRVSLFCRNAEQARELQETRINRVYLPAYRLPSSVTVGAELGEAVRGKRFIIGVTPSHGVREIFGQLGDALDPDAIV